MTEVKKIDAGEVRAALVKTPIALSISNVRVEPAKLGDHDLVVIELESFDITFESLVEVSKALGTTRINLDNDVREGGYCETCRYSYTVTVLTAWDVVLPEN
jgi:hypothetical protein